MIEALEVNNYANIGNDSSIIGKLNEVISEVNNIEAALRKDYKIFGYCFT